MILGSLMTISVRYQSILQESRSRSRYLSRVMKSDAITVFSVFFKYKTHEAAILDDADNESRVRPRRGSSSIIKP